MALECVERTVDAVLVLHGEEGPTDERLEDMLQRVKESPIDDVPEIEELKPGDDDVVRHERWAAKTIDWAEKVKDGIILRHPIVEYEPREGVLRLLNWTIGNKTKAARVESVPGYDEQDREWEYINPDGTPDEDMLKRVTESIVEAVEPRKIILFGSAARGQIEETSDIDIFVIKNDEPTQQVKERIVRNLPRRIRPTDIVVTNEAAVERNADKAYFITGKVLQEGRVLYDSGRV